VLNGNNAPKGLLLLLRLLLLSRLRLFCLVHQVLQVAFDGTQLVGVATPSVALLTSEILQAEALHSGALLVQPRLFVVLALGAQACYFLETLYELCLGLRFALLRRSELLLQVLELERSFTERRAQLPRARLVYTVLKRTVLLDKLLIARLACLELDRCKVLRFAQVRIDLFAELQLVRVLLAQSLHLYERILLLRRAILLGVQLLLGKLLFAHAQP
jgi:hypothetical protein